MTLATVLAELKAAGTAQNRTVYARHGVGPNQYGVSMAALKALRKRIKTDHALALALWDTGNHDARMLATMVADPGQADAALLDAWAADLDNYVLTDAFSGFVGRTPLARATMEAWTTADDEWRGQAGWNVLAHLAMKDGDLSDAYFEPYVRRVEQEVHTSKNRVRHAMNNALIAIGIRNEALKDAALATAAAVGTVEVDHGATGCTTPDAAAYIHKTLARRASR